MTSPHEGTRDRKPALAYAGGQAFGATACITRGNAARKRASAATSGFRLQPTLVGRNNRAVTRRFAGPLRIHPQHALTFAWFDIAKCQRPAGGGNPALTQRLEATHRLRDDARRARRRGERVATCRDQTRSEDQVELERSPLDNLALSMWCVVGAAGFEPTTCSTQNCRATRLRYTPIIWTTRSTHAAPAASKAGSRPPQWPLNSGCPTRSPGAIPYFFAVPAI